MKKRIFLVILLVVLCIINFLFNWYEGELFELIPIILLAYVPILILIEFLILINILENRKKTNKIINFVICLLYSINILFIFADMDIYKAKGKFYKNKENYMAEISEVQKQEIQEYTLLALDKEFYNLSTSHELFIYTNKPLIVEFWIFRGFFIGGSTSLIYIENDKEDEIQKTILDIEYIEKIENNWYFIKRN